MIDEYGIDNFSESYAAIYDCLHRQKPYAEEVRFALDRVTHLGGRRPDSVLDLAAGTGAHAAAFRGAGLRVHANDRSPAMLDIARSRNPEGVTFSSVAMERLDVKDVGGPFELVVGYYTALGYLSPAGLDDFLARLRSLLVPGGYFFADFWNGKRMAKGFSPRREKTVVDGHKRIRRLSTVTALPERASLEVRFDFEVEDQRMPHRFSETHRVRYDSPEDLRARLEFEGLELVETGPFFEEGPVDQAWNFYVVARRPEDEA